MTARVKLAATKASSACKGSGQLDTTRAHACALARKWSPGARVKMGATDPSSACAEVGLGWGDRGAGKGGQGTQKEGPSLADYTRSADECATINTRAQGFHD